MNRFAEGLALAAALIAVGALALVVYSVASRGASVISFDFLTQDPPAFGAGGGVAPEIVGSAFLVLVATAIAMPVGVLVALFLTEFAPPRMSRAVQISLDVLNGVPSIVVGVFIFGLLVAGVGDSGFAAALALSIIMLPLIARSTQEMLRLVPIGLREAAEALGVSRWRTVTGVLLPSALGGIITGTVLAVARAAGETAPLLLTSSIWGAGLHLSLFGQGIPNIPVEIFTLSESDDPSGFTRAWGLALVLLTFILLANIGARALYARSQDRMK